MISRYPFQTEILDDVRQGWKEFQKQVVVSPTGSGKTCMFSWMAEEFMTKGQRTLILVDQNELVWQTVEKLKAVTSIPATVEKSELRADRTSPVVVSTIQTMSRRLDEWPSHHFGLVIADEGDKSISEMWQRVLKHFDRVAKVCAFTATPHRTDKRNLGCYYQRLVEKENLISLQQKGYLSRIRIEMLPIQIDLTGARIKAGDFIEAELDEILGPHLLKIAEAMRDRAAFRKAIAFFPLIKTAEKFAGICKDIGLNAEAIHGKSEDREEKLARFKNWDFDILANSSLLTRGYDDPAIDWVLPCRPTKSVTMFFQMIGRATRLAPGKVDYVVGDFLYQSTRHLVCRPAHLIAKDDDEAEQITQLAISRSQALPGELADQMPLDLQGLASEAVAKREEALRKRLEEQRNKKAKTISAEQFAVEHNSMDVAEYREVMPWESAPITDKQLKWIHRAKIDASTVRGKGHASKLLSLYFDRKPLQLASEGQRKIMTRMGYPNAEQATADQARRFFADLRKPKQEEMAI